MESVNLLDTKNAVSIIEKSIPNLNGFDPTDENIKAVENAKNKNIGFWLFAEYFMKQNDPTETAYSLNYLGDENAIASWEIRQPENGDPDVFWIVDVQSKQKGGFTAIFNTIVEYCQNNNIEYIGLQAYNDNVKSMYINKFGFEEVDWFLLKKVESENIIKESVKQQLNEITSQYVYHWASPKTAYKIVSENRFSLMSTLFKGAEENIIGTSHNNLYYMSLTRNGKIGQGGYNFHGGYNVRFTLDGTMLNSNFHIKAIDYWGSSMGKNSRMNGSRDPYGKHVPKDGSETESEDRLYSRKPIINNALKYIHHIDILCEMDKINTDMGDMNSLPYIFDMVINLGKKVTVHKTVEDFNKSKNPISSSDFCAWYREQGFKFGHNAERFRKNDIPVKFLASTVYIVNFPYGDLSDCLKTLKRYNLEKYTSSVAKELQGKNSAWGNPYPFNFMKWNGVNGEMVKRIMGGFDGILKNIQLENHAQDLNRDDLSKGFQIITDFCNKHKLKTLNQIQDYFVKLVDNELGNNNPRMKWSNDNNKTISVQCAYIPNWSTGESVELCLDPENEKFADVFRHGKDALEYIYDDIKWYVERGSITHKSKSDRIFVSYLKRFTQGNPTVSEVMRLLNNLKSLGNEQTCEELMPVFVTKKIGGWECDNLTYKSDYTTSCRAADDSTIYLNDKKQIPQLIELWNSNVDS